MLPFGSWPQPSSSQHQQWSAYTATLQNQVRINVPTLVGRVGEGGGTCILSDFFGHAAMLVANRHATKLEPVPFLHHV